MNHNEYNKVRNKVLNMFSRINEWNNKNPSKRLYPMAEYKDGKKEA